MSNFDYRQYTPHQYALHHARKMFWIQMFILGATLLGFLPFAHHSPSREGIIDVLSFFALLGFIGSLCAVASVPLYYLSSRMEYRGLKKDQEETERKYWEAARAIDEIHRKHLQGPR